MKSFEEYAKDRFDDVPEDVIPGEWFAKHGLPMVVRCACCEMTMALPSAWIDDYGYTLCSDCAGVSGS